jgi:hypothetical protein
VPSGCAEVLFLVARRLRARQRAGQADGTLGWQAPVGGGAHREACTGKGASRASSGRLPWPELSEGCRKMTRRTPNLPIRLEQVEAPLILSAVDELAVGDGWPGGRSAEQAVRSAMPRRRLKR